MFAAGANPRWIVQDERDMQQGLIDRVLVIEHVLLAEMLTVVGGQDDERVLEMAASLERRHQLVEQIVELAKRRVVRGPSQLDLFWGVLSEVERVVPQWTPRAVHLVGLLHLAVRHQALAIAARRDVRQVCLQFVR